jgi:hypothetical protein
MSPDGGAAMIFRKLEIISYFITKHGEIESWVELMALTALDSIKADILRIAFMCEPQSEEKAIDRMGTKARLMAFLEYEANFEEWLGVRGGAGETDEQTHERSDREEDLTRFLLTAPLVRDWMIFHKFEVFGHYFKKYGDKRGYVETMAAEGLANIKLDLLRCGLRREEARLERFRRASEETNA